MDCATESRLMNFYGQNWKVYADAFQSSQELTDNIRAVIDEIEAPMCENVTENFIKRTWSCKRSVEAI